MSLLLAVVIVIGSVTLHPNTDWTTLVVQKPQVRTQRPDWPSLTPADVIGVERRMMLFGPTFFIDPTYRDMPNSAQMP